MSAHTPSPWRQFAPEVDGVIDPNYREVCAGREFFTAESPQSGFHFRALMTEADARLIAAAPDLYRALDALYEAYVVDLHGRKTCDCDPSVTRATCAPCLARAALAKVNPDA
jgi:hypothetical protein